MFLFRDRVHSLKLWLLLLLTTLFLWPANTSASTGTLAVELLPRPATGVPEYVSLTLMATGTVDISGWRIEDTLASPSVVYTFPTSTILTTGTPLRVCQLALATVPTAPCNAHFGGTAKWNNDGDTLRLFSNTNVEVLTLPYVGAVIVGELLETTTTVTLDLVEEPPPPPPPPPPPDPEEEEEEDEPPPPPPPPVPVDTPKFVTFCKAINSHLVPFIKIKLPYSVVMKGKVIKDADIVPSVGTSTGQNLTQNYLLRGGTLTGQQILDKKCLVLRPKPRHFWWFR